MELTPHEAQYALAVLVKQGKLRASQVRAALKWRQREIRQLQMKLASLEGLASAASAAKRRGGRKLSARVRSLRRLQGRYMGFVRRLKPAEKARVRAVREKKGLGPAIRLAASLAKKS